MWSIPVLAGFQKKKVMEMRKLIFLGLTIFTLFILFGCKATHPSKVVTDPDFNPNEIVDILVAPVISSISEAEDPNRYSETIMNRVLSEKLSERDDYKFLSQQQFMFALKKAGLEDRFKKFKEQWIRSHTLDMYFISRLRKALNTQTMLIPLVYLWHKDEADYREESSVSSTQVGATMTLVDMETGKILWEATDENYKESVRSEMRSVVVSGGYARRIDGISATGRDQYAAPPYSDVAVLVVNAIVNALPRKTAIE